MATFYGYVMNWPNPEPEQVRQSRTDLFVARVCNSPELVSASSQNNEHNSQWRALRLVSDKPLRGEELDSKPEFRYKVMVRVSEFTNMIVVGSETTRIANLSVQLMQRELSPKMRPLQILVDKLTEYLLEERRSSFAISSLVLDVPKYGADLRSMELYGEDIARAGGLRREISEYTTREIGLREASAAKESARLGATGTVRFYDDRLGGIEKSLNFAKKLDLYVS